MRIQEPPRQRHRSEQETTISRLLNSIYYFLDFVFVISSDEGYRLVILHQDRVIMDASYSSLRGAKIAFAKFFYEQTWAENVQPKWSHFYQPQHNWLDKKLRILNKDSRRRSDSPIK